MTVTEADAGVSIAAAGGQSHVSPPPPLRPAAGLPGARPHTLPAGTQVACGREQLFQISVVKMARGEGSWCVTGVSTVQIPPGGRGHGQARVRGDCRGGRLRLLRL